MSNNRSVYLKTLAVTGIIQMIGFYLSFTRNPDSYNILDPLEYGIKEKLPLDIYTIISLTISLEIPFLDDSFTTTRKIFCFA